MIFTTHRYTQPDSVMRLESGFTLMQATLRLRAPRVGMYNKVYPRTQQVHGAVDYADMFLPAPG